MIYCRYNSWPLQTSVHQGPSTLWTTAQEHCAREGGLDWNWRWYLICSPGVLFFPRSWVKSERDLTVSESSRSHQRCWSLKVGYVGLGTEMLGLFLGLWLYWRRRAWECQRSVHLNWLPPLDAVNDGALQWRWWWFFSALNHSRHKRVVLLSPSEMACCVFLWNGRDTTTSTTQSLFTSFSLSHRIPNTEAPLAIYISISIIYIHHTERRIDASAQYNVSRYFGILSHIHNLLYYLENQSILFQSSYSLCFNPFQSVRRSCIVSKNNKKKIIK